MVVLAHLSDLHVSPLPRLNRHEFTLKRALAYLSWHRKRKHHFSTQTLSCLIEDIHAHNPDHIAVTGDLCNLSLKAEFLLARQWLERIGSAENVSVIPGNHDAHIRDRESVWRQYWQPFLLGDDAKITDVANTLFPYVRKRGNVAIIAVSSAVPTPLFFAGGYVGKMQRKKLRDVLRYTQQQGLFRIVMIHHPLQPNAVSRRKSLLDAQAMRTLLLEEGAELILHGHGHIPTRAVIDGPVNGIVVRGTAAASAYSKKMPAAHYHLIAITPHDSNADVWQVTITHRHFDMDTHTCYTSDTESFEVVRPAINT